jgi:hypothetical protein
MTVDERALYEAERWFRAKLRGDSALVESEIGLFTVMAERQVASTDFYIPREPSTQGYLDPFADSPLITLPPPSSAAQRDWIQLSKASLRPRR